MGSDQSCVATPRRAHHGQRSKLCDDTPQSPTGLVSDQSCVATPRRALQVWSAIKAVRRCPAEPSCFEDANSTQRRGSSCRGDSWSKLQHSIRPSLEPLAQRAALTVIRHDRHRGRYAQVGPADVLRRDTLLDFRLRRAERLDPLLPFAVL